MKSPVVALEAMVKEYVDGYELRDCESADGRIGDYTPNERERMLILDAIQGLIADEEFIALVKALPWP